MLGHQFQQLGGSFRGAAVYEQNPIGPVYGKDISACSGDQKEIFGELFDFEVCLSKGTSREGCTSRAGGKAPQECTTVGWMSHRY
jgi:hypothetical protein